MGINEFLGNIKIALGLNNHTIAILTTVFAIALLLVKLFNYIVIRVDTKDDKQFEVLYKIIEDKDFFTNLNKQPYLFKQLFYKRFYLLKEFKVEEIEFLLSQTSLSISIYQLESIKSGKIIEFKDNCYSMTVNPILNFWINHYWITIIIMMCCFLLAIIFFTVLFFSFFNSLLLFSLSMIILFLLELYLINKNSSIKDFLVTQIHIDDFITKSIIYRDTHDN